MAGFTGSRSLTGSRSVSTVCRRRTAASRSYRDVWGAGCKAVGVIRRNTLWERQAPPLSDRRARGVFELRIRLGLFFAASLRYVVHGACRLRIKIDDVEWHPGLGGLKAGGLEWHPVTGDGVSFRKLLTGHAGAEPCRNVVGSGAWNRRGLRAGGVFFPSQGGGSFDAGRCGGRAGLRAGRVARGVFSAGCWGLRDRWKMRRSTSPRCFLEGLVQAVDERALRVNTRVNGHVFITSEFWFVTTPAGIGDALGFIRTRGKGGRYDWPRHEIFNVLHSDGHLVGVAPGDKGRAVRVYEVDVEGWEKPLELNGLAISVESLPAERKRVPPFEGTVVFKKEIAGGNDEG